MEHLRPSEADDSATWSTHQTNGSNVYSEVRGNLTNVSSISQLSSELGHGLHQCNIDDHVDCREETRCPSFKKFGFAAMRRLRPGKAAAAAKPPPTQPATGGKVQPKAPRRNDNGLCGIGEVVGGFNSGAIADSGYAELHFRGDPSLSRFPDHAPFMPAPVDGVSIGRVIGNANTGAVGPNARLVMMYEPRRDTSHTTPSSSRSPLTTATESLVDSHCEGEASRHGYSKIAPRDTRSSPPGTFPGSGRTLSQGGTQSRGK